MAKSFGYFLQKKVSGIFIAFFHGSLKKIMSISCIILADSIFFVNLSIFPIFYLLAGDLL